GKSEFIAGFIHLNANLAIFRMFRLEQLFSQRLLYILLDGPFERAGTILFVKAFLAEKILCSIAKFHRKAQLDDAAKRIDCKDINNFKDILFFKRTESNDIINTV